ncbi:MAG TPA: hypothetical protein VFB54_07325 [Burkholderiales bacterium]|nr:hypothetical protein [Burkholderiales bacterium]
MAKPKSAKAKKSGKAAAAEKREVHTLDWRDCQLPTNINFRTQKHGDEAVQATDIRVSEIELSKDEIEALAQEKYASRVLWATVGRGKPERPTLERFEPLKLTDAIESARVAIRVGGEEIKLGVSKLKAVTIARKPGGVAHLSCLVQATPAINAKLATLIAGMDGQARIRIEYEHNAEQLEADLSDEKSKTDPEGEKFEQDAKAQIDAWNRGSDVAGDSVAGETH